MYRQMGIPKAVLAFNLSLLKDRQKDHPSLLRKHYLKARNQSQHSFESLPCSLWAAAGGTGSRGCWVQAAPAPAPCLGTARSWKPGQGWQQGSPPCSGCPGVSSRGGTSNRSFAGHPERLGCSGAGALLRLSWLLGAALELLLPDLGLSLTGLLQTCSSSRVLNSGNVSLATCLLFMSLPYRLLSRQAAFLSFQ